MRGKVLSKVKVSLELIDLKEDVYWYSVLGKVRIAIVLNVKGD